MNAEMFNCDIFYQKREDINELFQGNMIFRMDKTIYLVSEYNKAEGDHFVQFSSTGFEWKSDGVAQQ